MSKAQMLKRIYFSNIPIFAISGGVSFGIISGKEKHSYFKIYDKYQDLNPGPAIRAREITIDVVKGACEGVLMGTFLGLTWPVVVPIFTVSYLANR